MTVPGFCVCVCTPLPRCIFMLNVVHFCILMHASFVTATFQCSTVVTNPPSDLLKLVLIQSAILGLSAPPSSLNVLVSFASQVPLSKR